MKIWFIIDKFSNSYRGRALIPLALSYSDVTTTRFLSTHSGRESYTTLKIKRVIEV